MNNANFNLFVSAQSASSDDSVPDPLHGNDKTVAVHCLWDSLLLHAEAGPSMYVLWRQNQTPSPLINALLTDQTQLNRT